LSIILTAVLQNPLNPGLFWNKSGFKDVIVLNLRIIKYV